MRRKLPRPSDRRAIGNAGLRISPICIGAVKDPVTIVEAFDAGVNFFFITADMHWPLYEATRRGLEMLFERASRDAVVVAVASYTTQPEFCNASFGEVIASVRGLRRVDTTVIGGSYSNDFIARRTVYSRHASANGARAIGCTFHDRDAAGLAIANSLVDVALIRYNAGHRGAETDVFPSVRLRQAARSRAATPLLYSFKTASSFVRHDAFERLGVVSEWRPAVTDHYRFTLSQPEIDGILCAPENPRQLRELLDCLDQRGLYRDEIDYLAGLSCLEQMMRVPRG